MGDRRNGSYQQHGQPLLHLVNRRMSVGNDIRARVTEEYEYYMYERARVRKRDSVEYQYARIRAGVTDQLLGSLLTNATPPPLCSA